MFRALLQKVVGPPFGQAPDPTLHTHTIHILLILLILILQWFSLAINFTSTVCVAYIMHVHESYSDIEWQGLRYVEHLLPTRERNRVHVCYDFTGKSVLLHCECVARV